MSCHARSAPVPVQPAPTPVFQPYGYNASVKPEQGAWPRVPAQQQQMTHPSQGVAAALGYAQHMAAGQQQQLQLRLQMQQQAAHLQAQQHMQQQQQLAMQQLAASLRLPKADGSGPPPALNNISSFNNLLPGNSSSESDASRKRKQPDLPAPLNQGPAWSSGALALPSPLPQQQLVQQQLFQLQQLQQQQLQQSYAQSRTQQGLAWQNAAATIPAPAHLTIANPVTLPQQRLQQQAQPGHTNGSSGTMPLGVGSSNPGVIPQHDGPGDVPGVGGSGAGPSKPSASRKPAAPTAAGTSSNSKATPAAAEAASAAAEQGGTEELLSSDDEGSVEEEEVSNFLCGQFEKVTRAKHKWKITMKDGVFHADGKDYLFKRGTAEFMWTG